MRFDATSAPQGHLPPRERVTFDDAELAMKMLTEKPKPKKAIKAVKAVKAVKAKTKKG